MQWIILPLLAALAALTAVHHPIPHRPLLSDTTTLYATSAAQLRGRAIPDSVTSVSDNVILPSFNLPT